MPRLRRLTSREVLSILRGFGFEVSKMRRSHAKLVRITPSGERQTLTVPLHPQLPIGTVQAIYRQASRFISLTDLQPKFFPTNPAPTRARGARGPVTRCPAGPAAGASAAAGGGVPSASDRTAGLGPRPAQA